MEMSKVYYCSLYSDSQSRNLPNNVKKLFERASFREFISENEQVAVKLHFGEKGNTTYMSPIAVRQVVDKVKEYGENHF
ncbi:hypothetical protein AAIB48_04345 [Paraclostridium benzoelyticum]|uniref:hypothetical protein n=1 Tax=Paraclostridium benzoelyticum TaxID=1629550 RepID=UPI0031CDA0F4